MHLHRFRAFLLLLALLVGLSCRPDMVAGDDQGTTSDVNPRSASEPAYARDFALPLPLFAAVSPWNQRVSAVEVLPDSDRQILTLYRVLRGDNSSLHPPQIPPLEWPYMDVNYDDYAMPIFRAGTGQQSVLICDYEGNLGWTNDKLPISQAGGPVQLPSAATPMRPAGPEATDSHGHLILYDVGQKVSFDFWQATTERSDPCTSLGGGRGGSIILEAGAVDYFDVTGAGVDPDGYSSARATGVPLLAGLLLPEDIEQGTIQHALAVSVPGLRNSSPTPSEPLASDYYYPTSTTETDYYSTDPLALAAGQRLRLKEAIYGDEGALLEETSLAPITRLFLSALREYGAYVVDNAGGLTFYAEDVHTAPLHLGDAQINALIGAPTDSSLSGEMTRWQIVLQALNRDLGRIPLAQGPWQEGQDPATATIALSNFEVVAPASRTIARIYLPLILRDRIWPTDPVGEPFSLHQVRYWAYQIQGIDGTGILDALANSHYDLLVLEPTRTDWSSETREFDTRAMVDRLKGTRASDGLHRKLVVGYVDIGEAEDWRWYWTWSQDWNCLGRPPADWPDYILTCDPDGWSGNYPVAYWDPRWQDIMIDGRNQSSAPYGDYVSAMDELLRDGFDWIYLDWVEAFENDAVIAAAQAAGLDPVAEMVAFVSRIRNYARSRNPNFLVIQQNASNLRIGHPELYGLIDAIAQEGIWYEGDATDNWEDPEGHDWIVEASLTEEYLEALQDYLNAGLPVLDCEYALAHADTAYSRAYSQGYIPYVTRRSLGALSTTPPPSY